MTNNSPKPWLAWTCALGTVLCWSTVSSAFKISLEHTTPLTLLWIASLSSCLFLTLLSRHNAQWQISNLWQQIKVNKPRPLFIIAVLALLNPVGYYLILFAAYALLPGQLAQPLNFTWPIVLLLLSSIINRQPLTILQYLALLLSFFGVLWIATQGNPLSFQSDANLLGIALALVSTLLWAVYWVISTKQIADNHYQPIALLTLLFWIGSTVLTILVLLNYIIQPQTFAINNTAILGGIYIGIFEMGLAFVLWQIALANTTQPAILGNIIYLTPFGSLLVLSIFVEEIHHSSWIGLVFIIIGIILQSLAKPATSR
jgi:drug/metabolite transporter (DMT)-like permease